MKNIFMFVTLSILAKGLQATNPDDMLFDAASKKLNGYISSLSKGSNQQHGHSVHVPSISQAGAHKAIQQAAKADQSAANLRKEAAMFCAKQAETATSTIVPLVESSIPNTSKKVWTTLRQGGDFKNLVAIHSLPSFERQVSKGTLRCAMDIADKSTSSGFEKQAQAAASATVSSAKSSIHTVGPKIINILPVAKWGVVGAVAVGGAGMLYKYNKSNQDEKVKKERLAHRSYFEKTYDSISDFAKSAKINTWDSNYGFNHSGKVATVAGVTAMVGLSYGAYQAYQHGYFAKMNPFGKAVVKTVETKDIA